MRLCFANRALCYTRSAEWVKGEIFFCILCVSEHFESIKTLRHTNFFIENFYERRAQNMREQSEKNASANPE